MKAVVQRVRQAKVTVDGRLVGEVGPGLLTLLGIERGDDEATLSWMIAKILDLRIFPDSDGKMNLSVKDTAGGHLLVSQFTLAGDCSRGKRPAFTNAEEPARAKSFYDKALALSRSAGITTAAGEFGADMQVTLVNDGPVTLILEKSPDRR